MSPSLNIYLVDSLQDKNPLNITICIQNNQRKETAETPALLDSGAGGIFIDQNHAWKMKYQLTELKTLVKAYNVDGTENKRGTIQSYVNLEFSLNGKNFKERFYVTGLGKQKIILGLPWLEEHNPEINWKTGKLKWQTQINLKWFFILKKKDKQTKTGHMEKPKSKSTSQVPQILEELDEEE